MILDSLDLRRPLKIFQTTGKSAAVEQAEEPYWSSVGWGRQANTFVGFAFVGLLSELGSQSSNLSVNRSETVFLVRSSQNRRKQENHFAGKALVDLASESWRIQKFAAKKPAAHFRRFRRILEDCLATENRT